MQVVLQVPVQVPVQAVQVETIVAFPVPSKVTVPATFPIRVIDIPAVNLFPLAAFPEHIAAEPAVEEDDTLRAEGC